MKNRRGKLAELLLQGLLVLCISIFPVVFLYCNNVGEMTVQELATPLAVYAGLGVAVWLVSFIFLRGRSFQGLVAALWSVALLHYAYVDDLLRQIMPEARYAHSMILLITVLIYISLLICKMKPDTARMATQIGCAVVAVMLAVNGVTAVVNTPAKTEDTPAAATPVPVHITSANTDKPNVYWLLFDEYSSNQVLETYYHYDNSAFTDMLESLGFNVSYTSRNDSCDTLTVMTNMMNLDYIVKTSTPVETKKQYWAGNSVIQQMFEANGYTYLGVGNSDTFLVPPINRDVTSASFGQAVTVDGTSVNSLLINRTILKPFLVSNGLDETYIASDDYFNNVIHINYFNYWQKLSVYEHTDSRFTFGYLILPHQPFVYTASGAAVDPHHYNDWADTRYYLDQLIYTTKLITKQIQTILQNDPDCIIVLQSDHSARRLLNDTLNFTEASTSCFNAVYYRGEPMEVEGLSGINLWRYVLNRLFGTEYDELQLPPFEEGAD